jgi:predicted nuclease of predicted toxin-antitoxin system
MSVALYFDVHVPRAIAQQLRLRGVDVLTAQEDGTDQLLDSELLDRAMALNRVLFSQDDDLLREATQRQRHGEYFAGVIYAHQLKVTIGQCVQDLELIAKVTEPKDFADWVEYLPLS